MQKRIKIPKINIRQLINNLNKSKKEKIIIEINKNKISREKLYKDILRTQNYLISIGTKKNHKIVSLLENSYEQILLFLATLGLGATWVPLGNYKKGIGLNYILSLIKPQFIFIRKNKINDIPINFKKNIKIIKDKTIFKNKINKIKKVIFSSNVNTILFTSGTTGPPKGVIVNDKMLIASSYATGIASDSNGNDRYLLWESLHHIGGIEILILCLLKFSSLVIIKKFSAKKFWKQNIKYKITVLHYLGGILDILIKQPKTIFDKKHSIKIAFGAGARKETYSIFKKRFNIPLREVYGMTEASSFTTINFKNHIGSIGQVLPWFKVKIINSKNGIGEIAITSKDKNLITKGYFRDYKSTKNLLVNNLLYTGDIGKFDKHQNLYYIGRKKDSIRVKGENISSWEIESNLNEHINISESAVLPVKSDIGEEDIVALLLLKKRNKINIKNFANHFKSILPKNYNPRYWAVVKSFPRTPTYRIDKKLIDTSKIRFYDYSINEFRFINRKQFGLLDH